MKYIYFLTPDKEKQAIIIKAKEALEKELDLGIKINNLIGDVIYIKVKRKRRFIGSNDSSIKEKVKEVFSPSGMKIVIFLVGK